MAPPPLVPVAPPAPIPASSLPPSSIAPSNSLVSRTQRWVEENKYLVLGAAVVAAGGMGYYLYANQPPALVERNKEKTVGESSSDEDAKSNVPGSTSQKSKKKKKSKSKKSSSTGKSDQGPLLEERDPEEVKRLQETRREEESQNKPSVTSTSTTTTTETKSSSSEPAEKPSYLEGIPEKNELSSISAEERKKFATMLKNRGNKLYAQKHYDDAAACYTHALEVAVVEEAVYYSNRAACWQNMTPPRYEQVLDDCDKALKLDPAYVKALNRRATAFENLGRDEEALRDFTATTIMERFQNASAGESVERVLKKISTKKAEEIMKAREPKLPSTTFVSSYLGAFRPQPKLTPPVLPSDSVNTGNNTLKLATEAEGAGDYTRAFILCNEAIEQGVSADWVDGQAFAYNMRGTYKFMVGDTPGAKADFEKSLDLKPEYVQSLVKVASVHMEMGDAAGAFGDFEAAIRHNANDPDIYYHRGQLYFITSEYEKAAADYDKSIELDKDFVFSHVQKAVCEYKVGKVRESMVAFRKILKDFPQRSEPFNYYGELLLDQQRFEDAVNQFGLAIEQEQSKSNGVKNVLPWVNKALGVFQWKQDMPQAEDLCKEALEMDPECDVAIATLAQLSLQQGKISEAIDWFEKSAKLARTEVELTTAITYEHASRAQLSFLQNYPQMAEKLGQLASQLS